MSKTQLKPSIKIKDPKRFKKHEENLKLQQKIFETFDEWSIEYLIDEMFLSLMSVKAQFCMINSNRKTSLLSDPKKVEFNNRCNYGNGIVRRTYEEQARYKMYRMAIYNPHPVFVIHLKHIDERVKVQLAKEDEETRNEILKQVAERIFETVDKRFFLLSGLPFLKVRCER
jgi:hypothetical protein